MQKLDDVGLTTKGFCKQQHLLSDVCLLVVPEGFGQEVGEDKLDKEKGGHHLDGLKVCRVWGIERALLTLTLL